MILNPDKESKRKWIALGIWLLSAVTASVAWHYGERAWLALGLLAGVWNFTADWLGGLPHGCRNAGGRREGPQQSGQRRIARG
jgi:hypothetical protein